MISKCLKISKIQIESKKDKIKAKVNKRIRVRESTLVSQQLYEYQIKKEIQIKNGEAATILLNNKVDSISGKSEKKTIYSRRNCLLIYGTSENLKEDTGNITIARPNQHFQIDMEKSDIEHSQPFDNMRNMKEN